MHGSSVMFDKVSMLELTIMKTEMKAFVVPQKPFDA